MVQTVLNGVEKVINIVKPSYKHYETLTNNVNGVERLINTV